MAADSKTGGRPPKITPAIAIQVADLVADGMPIRYALRMINEATTLPHWQKSLLQRPILLARYEKRLAERLHPMMLELDKCTLRTMPAWVWKIERRFPEDFAQPKNQGAQVNVTVNTCVGIEDSVGRRAAQLVKRWGKPVEIEATPVQEPKQVTDKK